MAYQNSINIGIQFTPQSQVKSELQTMLNNISKDTKFNLNFDFSNVTKSFTDFSNILKSTEQQILNFNTQLSNTGNNNSFNTTNQSANKLEATIERMNTKLNISTNNAFINPSVLSDLQNKINSISTNTPEREIRELQAVINNLGSSDSQIVRVQNSITKMTANLSNLKSKFGSELIDTKATSQVQSYEQQLEKLKSTLTQLKSTGSSIGGATITNELNNMTNASKNLTTTLTQTSSSASTFGSRMQGSLSSMGVYISTAMAIRKVLSEIKEGFQQVITVENSLVDLRRIYSMTDTEAKSLTQTISNQALVMGTNTQTLLDLTTQWKKLGYSIEDAQKLGEQTQMFDYSADLKNTEETAKSLVSVLKGFKLTADDATVVSDAIDAVGNNFAVNSSDINEALRVSSSALGAFGNDLNQSIAMATKMNEILQNASTTGQSLKSIASRLTSNDSAIKAIESVNIKLDDESGKLKSTYALVKELGKAYETMPDNADRANWLADLFGIRQVSAGVTLLNTYKELDGVITNIGENQGIVQKEFEVRMNATSGKIEQLKQTINQMWQNMISSDFTKGLIVSVTSLAKIFGNLPTIIGLSTTALMLFKGQAILGAISSMGVFIADLIAITAGESALTIATLGATTAFKALDIAITSNPLGFIAILFTGVAIAINKAKNAQDDLIKSNKEVIDSYNSEKESLTQANKLYKEKQDLENKISSTNEGTKENKELKEKLLEVERSLAIALPNSVSGYDSQNKAIASNNELIKAQIDLKNKQLQQDSLKQLKDNTTMFDGDQNSFKNQQQMLEAFKKSRDEMLEKNSNASANGNEIIKFTTQQAIDDYDKEIAKMEQSVAQRRVLILQLLQTGKSYKEIANDIGESESVVKSYTDVVNNNTSKTQENTDAKEKNKDVGTNAEEEADTENAKTEAIAKATIEYNKSAQAIAKAEGYIQKLTKAQTVTPTLGKSIATSYKDIGTDINNVGDAIDFLKGKVQEQQEAQENSLFIMKGNDSDYYKEKVANNQDYEDQINNFLDRFTSDSKQAYDVDLSQFTSLNQMKAGVQNNLKGAIDSFMSSFVDTSAEGYKVDYANFSSLINAKKEVLKAMAGTMAQFFDDTSQSFTEGAYGGVDLSGSGGETTEQYKAFEDKAKGILATGDKIRSAYSGLDKIFAGGGLNFNGFDGGSNGGVSDFGNSSGGSDKSADKAQKEADDALKKAQEWADKISELKSDIKNDPYLEDNNKLAQLESQLQVVKTSQDGLTGSELAQAKTKENEILQKQIDTYKNLEAKQEIEKDNIAYTLSQYGILKDSTGQLSNATEILAQKQSEIDNMVGSSEPEYEAKKTAISQLKQINDYVTQYGAIINKTIPDTIDKYEQLANAIKKANEESLSSLRDKLASGILADAQKEVDKLKEQLANEKENEIKDLNDEKTSALKSYDAEIKLKQTQINALDTTSEDNNKKLKALQDEKALWEKETDNVYKKSKLTDLDTQITDLTKIIKKDSLQKDIDSLNEQKTAVSDSYDKQLSDLNDYYDEQEKTADKKYKKMLNEKSAYSKADKLLTSDNQKGILKILNDNATNYKDVGTLLGKNFTEAFKEEIAKAENALKSLKDIKIPDSSTPSNSGGGTTGTGTSKADVNYVNADGSVTTISGKDGTSTTTGGSSSSGSSSKSTTKTNSNGSKTTTNNDGTKTTTSADGKVKETSGKTSTGSNYTIVARYANGGRTGDLGADGKYVIADSNEMITNAEDTKKFDDIWNHVKVADDTIMQLSNMVNLSSSYSLPSAISQIDLNKLANSVTNTNNTDNSVVSPVEMHISIVNNNGAEAVMNQKTLENMVIKVLPNAMQKSATKYGGKGFTNR